MTELSRPIGLPNASTSCAGLDRVGVRERQRRQSRLVHLEDRQVGFVVFGHDLRGEHARARTENRTLPGDGAGVCNLHLHAVRALDDVRVGDDVAGRSRR